MNRLKSLFVPLITVVITMMTPMLVVIPVSAASPYEVGISTSTTLLRMKPAQLDQRLNDIQALGAKWIRVDFSWATIQSDGPHVYHWQYYDKIVQAASAHNLKILAVIDYTPTWAAEPRCAQLVITKAAGHKCNPKSEADFAHFASVVSYRYRNQSIRAWEIWNEPNLSSYWKTAQANSTAVHADPVAYARFANAAAQQIRYHDPDGVIITGGLSPMFEPVYPKGYSQGDFLARMLPHLNKNLFNGIGIHPYSWPALPDLPASYNAYYTVDHGHSRYNLHDIMQQAGWGNKQIWGTEFGASTSGLRLAGGGPISRGFRPDHVSESMQAEIVQQGIDQWHTKPGAGPLFIHSDSDQWLSKRKNEGGFGLRRQDGSKKPAYDAVLNTVHRLSALGNH